MNSRIATWLTLGCLSFGATWVAAQPMGVPPGRWWERPRVAEQLALGEEQKTKLESAALASARGMIDLKAEVEKAELDLKAAADIEPLNVAKVREAFKALQQARVRLESERFEMLLKFREVLTQEQWRKLQELKRDRLRERGGPSPEDGPREPRPGRLRRPI
jgi:Spy/CpxP family protein refolding chaperone